jgi:hypothetical protein
MTNYLKIFDTWLNHDCLHLRLEAKLDKVPSSVIRVCRYYQAHDVLRKEPDNIMFFQWAVETTLRVQEDLLDAGLIKKIGSPPEYAAQRYPEDRLSVFLRWQRACAPHSDQWIPAWECPSTESDLFHLVAELDVWGIPNNMIFVDAIVRLSSIMQRMKNNGIMIKNIPPPIEGLEEYYSVYVVMES